MLELKLDFHGVKSTVTFTTEDIYERCRFICDDETVQEFLETVMGEAWDERGFTMSSESVTAVGFLGALPKSCVVSGHEDWVFEENPL